MSRFGKVLAFPYQVLLIGMTHLTLSYITVTFHLMLRS